MTVADPQKDTGGLLQRLLDPHALWPLAAIGVVMTMGALVPAAAYGAIGGAAWLALMLLWTMLTALALWFASRSRHPAALTFVLAAAAAMRLGTLFSQPYLSTDIYRYVWDGRVQAAGINPYRYLPAAPELASLRDADVYPNINRADYAPTIYPPVAQMIFRAVHAFGDGVLVMRLGMLAFDALAIASLIGILRALSLPPVRVVAYAWHPLALWETAGNGHIDVAMLALMLAGIWIFLRAPASNATTLRSGVLVALAAFIKPTALLAMPVLWKPWDWKLPAVLVGVAAAVYVPYLSAGTKVFGFLGGYVAEEGFSDGTGLRYVRLLGQAFGAIPGLTTAYILGAALVLVALALRASFRPDRSPSGSIAALSWLLIAFMLLLTPHYPWYYLALVPLLAVGRGLAPWVLTGGSFVLYNEIYTAILPPMAWRQNTLDLLALAAVAYDIWGLPDRATVWLKTLAFKKQEARP